MKCKRCKKKAITYLRNYRLALCDNCYVKFYMDSLKRDIKRYEILKRSERILACVSGGKDSLAMAYALKKLDYDIEVLYIDLGIGNYSKNSKRIVEEFASTFDLNLNVVKLEDYGFRIEDVEFKKVCSVCGTAKRYIMNRFARINGFDVVSTGHTAEDIILFFIKNVLSGNMEFVQKLRPRIEGFDKFVTKSKPVFTKTEKENALLLLSLNIPFVTENCPYAPKDIWKEIIYDIEYKKPGFKQNFIRNLVKLAKYVKYEEWKLKHCKICGEISNSDICSFCKIVKRYSKVGTRD